MKRLPFILLGLAIILGAYGVALYNSLQRADESVNAAWSEVVNQYQRRADLVPNLVETVKGYAKHEQTLLTEITAARARVSSMAPTPEMLSDATALERYRAAQSELGNSLARLLAVSENYPDLKASRNFENLMTQLEGTENRITTARNRYIEQVRDYNSRLRTFPASLIASSIGMTAKANFQVENEAAISAPPQVSFQ
ncbi:MAG: LemA family protein [Cardiobacterium hominis]